MLDPDDARPPYAQVAAALRFDIDQGLLPPGAKLPTHQELATHYGVSVGTVKRALGELQALGLVVSRQGQGTFVRTRRSLLDSIPPTLSAETLAGLWVTAYQFHSQSQGALHHADITRLTPQSPRRLTARNHPPEPRTEGRQIGFRNEIEAQLATRHVIGHWRNTSDTRYFGCLHLAVLPGESIMSGYYTALSSDITVNAMPWRWIRLDPTTLAGVELTKIQLMEPASLYKILTDLITAPIPLSTVIDAEL